MLKEKYRGIESFDPQESAIKLVCQYNDLFVTASICEVILGNRINVCFQNEKSQHTIPLKVFVSDIKLSKSNDAYRINVDISLSKDYGVFDKLTLSSDIEYLFIPPEPKPAPKPPIKHPPSNKLTHIIVANNRIVCRSEDGFIFQLISKTQYHEKEFYDEFMG